MLERARQAHKHVEALLELSGGADSSAWKNSAQELVEALKNHFELGAKGKRSGKKKEVRKVRTKQQLHKALQYQRGKVKRLKAQERSEISPRDGLRITYAWLIRTGLADPTLPASTLASLCNEFALSEKQTISKTSVSNVRDAWVEIIKQMNRQRAKLTFDDQRKKGDTACNNIYVVHLHAGADMKLRSYEQQKDQQDFDIPRSHLRLSRARASKIQNHSVDVHVGAEQSFPWYTELMPMAKKDQITIASSIIAVLTDIWSSLGLLDASGSGVNEEAHTVRFVHLITGDAINTNEAAARRVLYYSRNMLPRHVRYRMLVFRCAAHKCNLVTVAAICGRDLSTLG